ncbi:MAG: AMP-binding protein, partial [Marinirhabdus sp.]
MVLPYLHKHFAFNGLSFSTVAQLRIFAEELSHGTHEHNVPIGNFLTEWLSEHPTVSVKTSGATGTPKNIALAKANMVNSAKATAAYFNLPEKTNALLCLPTAYIAGKMMLVRAMVMGWELQAVAPGKNVIAQNDKKYDFAAMVPYQVYHSMPGLDNIKKLIVGGGAIPYNLERQLQDKTTQAYATYGMTETITHVAARPINGAQKSKHYTALPNVAFSKDPRGCLIVTAPHITPSAVTTNDSVALISPTAFTWSGRYDNVVNSGGVK